MDRYDVGNIVPFSWVEKMVAASSDGRTAAIVERVESVR